MKLIIVTEICWTILIFPLCVGAPYTLALH